MDLIKSFILKALKKIKNPVNVFDQDIDSNIKFLSSLPEPKNLIERSYFQFKCQRFQKSDKTNFIESFLSAILVFPLLLVLLLKGLFKSISTKNKNKNSAVFLFSSIQNVVPEKLINSFEEYEIVKLSSFRYLKVKDVLFLFQFVKYLKSPYFFIKVLYKLSIYRNFFDTYNPNTIICTSEYSFTSSILTRYCNINSVEHVNVMHGDKLLNIRDSFFCYNKCYVWDEFYKKLFIKLRAKEGQFCVDLPPSHLSLGCAETAGNFKYEMTYYLGSEKKETLLRIKDAFEKSKVSLNEICLRPHPRYSNLEEIMKIFKNEIIIEDTSVVSIINSLKQTKKVISLRSTVLFQAYLMNKQIVIDDYSQREEYEKLNEMNFIMFSKEHELLSEIL